MSCYKQHEKVAWISPLTGEESLAFFVKHDTKGFPLKDCILAIGIGPPGEKMRHTFRWPLRYVRKLRQGKVGRTITKR